MTDLAARYREVADLHFAAEVETDPDAARAAFAAAIREAERLAAEFPTDGHAQYLAGLIWYDSPDMTAERSAKVKEFLGRSLALDPDHPYAPLYTGHHLFDEGHYREALPLFESADRAFFERRNQRWRSLKADELALVCRLRLGEPVAVGDVRRLVDDYLALGSYDSAVPGELVRYVADLVRAGSPPDPEITQEVSRLVRGLGCTNLLRSDYGVITGALAPTSAKPVS